MKYHGLAPKLLLALLLLLILPGCVTERLTQWKGLTGDLFREECNRELPPDIQIIVEQRRNRYEEVNDIHNINFVTLLNYGCMPKKQYDELLVLRWELLRMNKENELMLEQTKILYHKAQKYPRRKTLQDLCAKYDQLRFAHDKYMRESSYLLDQTAPYKPGIIDKFM